MKDQNVHTTAATEQLYKKAMDLGLRLTSAYRDPTKNASVGGSKTSMHTSGHAYDFAGSPSAMKQLAEWAKQQGTFTEVLYETAGHYDHVHVGWAQGKHDGMYVGDGKVLPLGGSHSTATGDSVSGAVPSLVYGIIRVSLIFLLLVVGVVFLFSAFPQAQQAVKEVQKFATD